MNNLCPKCGTKAEDGGKFCGGCGASIAGTIAPANLVGHQPTLRSNGISKKTTRLPAVVALGTFVVIAGLGFFAFMEGSRNSKSASYQHQNENVSFEGIYKGNNGFDYTTIEIKTGGAATTTVTKKDGTHLFRWNSRWLPSGSGIQLSNDVDHI